ncbi:hypothetical protein HYY74_04060 [Candidatus Woesearchaeota archaeon]|nr:hypothetical protein [Candidatus Woesearchaeota archaeon]
MNVFARVAYGAVGLAIVASVSAADSPLKAPVASSNLLGMELPAFLNFRNLGPAKEGTYGNPGSRVKVALDPSGYVSRDTRDRWPDDYVRIDLPGMTRPDYRYVGGRADISRLIEDVVVPGKSGVDDPVSRAYFLVAYQPVPGDGFFEILNERGSVLYKGRFNPEGRSSKGSEFGFVWERVTLDELVVWVNANNEGCQYLEVTLSPSVDGGCVDERPGFSLPAAIKRDLYLTPDGKITSGFGGGPPPADFVELQVPNQSRPDFQHEGGFADISMLIFGYVADTDRGLGYFGMAYQPEEGQEWMVEVLDSKGRTLHKRSYKLAGRPMADGLSLDGDQLSVKLPSEECSELRLTLPSGGDSGMALLEEKCLAAAKVIT